MAFTTGVTARLFRSGRMLTRVPLADVSPNPAQPRRTFSEASIGELADSIRQYGLISPIIVRRSAGQYELIAGERRLRAMRRLGMTHAEAIIMPAEPKDSAIIALIENLQREDLNFFEEAAAYRRILAENGITQETLAMWLGKNPSTIANRLRLLRLAPEIRRQILSTRLTERHARALLLLPDPAGQRDAIARAAAQCLNVRQFEALIETMRTPKPTGSVRRAFRDRRMFVNAVLDTVKKLNGAGVSATSRVVEEKDATLVIVSFPHAATSAPSAPIPPVKVPDAALD